MLFNLKCLNYNLKQFFLFFKIIFLIFFSIDFRMVKNVKLLLIKMEIQLVFILIQALLQSGVQTRALIKNTLATILLLLNFVHGTGNTFFVVLNMIFICFFEKFLCFKK